MPHYEFETTIQLKSSGEMNKAEDWIRENVRGLWALEFLGMQEQVDTDTRQKSQVLHVRFKFGRKDDLDRFRNEYILGKPPAQAPRKPTTKPAPKKKKGLLGWLFD